MRLLHESELSFVLCLIEQPEKEFEFKVSSEDRSFFEGDQIIDFLKVFDKAGYIKIKNAYISYEGIYDDAFLKRYSNLITENHIEEAKKLAESMGLSVLNQTIDFRGSVEGLEDLINKIIEVYDVDNDQASFRIDLSWNIVVRLEKTENLQRYLDQYLEAFKKDELTKMTWKELKRPSNYYHTEAVEAENEYFNRDFYRYKKQRELMIDFLKKRIETQNPKNVIIKKWEELPKNINAMEILLCLEREGIITKLRQWELDDPQTYDLAISINEEKLNELSSTLKESDSIRQKTDTPSLIDEKGIGYLKFYKEGPKIEIGGIRTRKYRLLKALFEPLGVAKTIEVVFEAIKLPKDKEDGRLGDNYLSEERRRELIEYTMKELQKIKELKGKIRLDFINNKKSVRLLLDA